MDKSYTNKYNMNWSGNASFTPNTSNVPNIPHFIPYNCTQNPPFYHSPSDPRFKQSVFDEQPFIKIETTQKTEDEFWIETYLSKVGKSNNNLQSNIELPSKLSKTINNNKKSLKVHVAKSVLNRCINLLQNLQHLEKYLRENVTTISSSEWKQKTIEIGQQKDEFTALLSQFDDTSVIDHLQITLKKRKRKRKLLSQKKSTKQKEYKEKLKKRELINKNIDKWLENMKDEVERAKREETLKKDADCILAEVTKKKSDARKQLALLQALIKLRTVREQTAVANGEKINLQDSEAFKKNTEKLQKMWEKALKTYSIEEQGLKVMLEKDVRNEKLPTTAENKIVNDWETVLFGPKTVPCDAYWSLTCAEKDVRTFIAIRKSWDTFLSNDEEASRIPVGWILPDKIQSWLPLCKK